MLMLSQLFLVKLSNIISTVLHAIDSGEKNLPFGGLNMILVGNFHQFPPVICGHAAPLYYPNNGQLNNTEAMISREIYLQFSTAC